MDNPAEIAAGLTKAQRWALEGVAKGRGHYASDLGAHMLKRPGAKNCEVKQRVGYKAQGLAFVGGTMRWRLMRMGLIDVEFGDFPKARILPLGLAVRAHLENPDAQ